MLLTDVINPEVVDKANLLNREFSKAEPFRHVLIKNFFTEETVKKVINEFPKPEKDKMFDEFGNPNKKMACHDVRDIGGAYRKLDDCIRSEAFSEFMGKLTGIPNLLYDPEYHGAGTHDNYSTQGMDPHVDFNLHRTTGYHRRINAIIYLNRQWEEEWGGCLDLHKNPWEPDQDWKKTIVPLANHCILFETNEYSWHGFEPISIPEGEDIKSRKSFTIYMYTKERPQSELAEKHGTVYFSIKIDSDKAVSPKDANCGLDVRKMSFALKEIQFVHSFPG